MKTVDISELIEELRETPPRSTYNQVEEFSESVVFQDFKREWQIWIDDLRKLHELEGGKESSDYYRGAVQMLFKVIKTPEYIKSLIEEGQQDE